MATANLSDIKTVLSAPLRFPLPPRGDERCSGRIRSEHGLARHGADGDHHLSRSSCSALTSAWSCRLTVTRRDQVVGLALSRKKKNREAKKPPSQRRRPPAPSCRCSFESAIASSTRPGSGKSSARRIARGAERSSTRASRGSTNPPAERCEAGTLAVRADYPRTKVLVCSASFRKRRIASAVSRKLGRRTVSSTSGEVCHAMASTVV